MRILWIPAWYPTDDAPLDGTFFSEQVGMLRRAGERVVVFSTRAADRRSVFTSRMKLSHDRARGAYYSNVLVPPSPAVPGLRQTVAPWVRAFALRACAHTRPDVIHAHSAFPSIVVAHELARMLGVPFGFTEHRSIQVTYPRDTPRHREIARAVHAASFRLGVSQPFAAQLSDYFGAPFDALPLPVSDLFFTTRPTPAGETFTYLHVSLGDPVKRPDALVRAFGRVHALLPHTRCVLVGSQGEAAARLRRLATAAGVSDAVTLLGRQPRPEIARLMAGADAFVLVSERESAGAVFGEALASGIPIIASASAGGRSYASDKVGKLVAIGDEDALVDAMLEVHDRRARGELRAHELRAWAAERYSSATFVRDLTAIYARACA